jgi:hypothetical protein
MIKTTPFKEIEPGLEYCPFRDLELHIDARAFFQSGVRTFHGCPRRV